MTDRSDHCEYERDSSFSWCLAPWRFTVTRADGDQTYSGGRESGVYRSCEAHLADAVAGMADGDDVALTVTIRYDAEPTEQRKYGRRSEDRLYERCGRCGHTLSAHHWNGSMGGRCCEEIDRAELCSCAKFQRKRTRS